MDRVQAIKILGLNSNYTESDLKKAFYLLAKKYHPDSGENYDVDKFNEVVSARDCLVKNQGKDETLKQQNNTSQENNSPLDDICKNCRGTGIVRQKVKVSSGFAIAKVKCKYCKGTGKKRF